MARQKYPDFKKEFRLPNFTPYSLSINMGVLRGTMNEGASDQRRKFSNMPTVIGLEFVMTWESLRLWQEWVNRFAYKYFEMDTISMTGWGYSESMAYRGKKSKYE